MNLFQIIGLLKNAGNPKKYLANILRQNAGNNPVMNNALNMYENNDMAGIEKLARNLCNEKGVDANQALAQAKNMLGL